ncbi:MAG: Gfo/Idh/MocA family oxidoreductase [Clostridia bacterium]|nr:Gfo/Idh/MocA family oxidoreductase [Clostridia bacterium]
MKSLRIGVFGVNRGMDIAKNFMLLNCEIAALCDFRRENLEQAAKGLGDDVGLYEDFDAFLNHGLDAVILANYFHEHAPYAIRCMEKGIHVFSECISNGTMAEGVELIRAFEKSKSIYFLAENYPQMIFNREMKRICDTKTLGKILYAEGEYNHPGDPADLRFRKRFNYFPGHWRNFLPKTYYVTHSLGPIMRATGATPKRVTAFASYLPVIGDFATASHVGDRIAVITTLNDDDSIFRFTGHATFGAHHNAYRICGTKGQIENLRGMGDKVMLRYNDWEKPEGGQETSLYDPGWNDKDEELIKQSGHGGADFLTARMFVDCIKEGKQPEHPFDVYAAVNMSSVAILAHRSVLEGGMPYDIPDFKDEAQRKLYENDRKSPFCSPEDANHIPCCSHPEYKPTEQQLKKYKEIIMDN